MKLSSLLAWPVICFVVLANHPLAAQPAADANKAKLEQRDQLWQQAVQFTNEGKHDHRPATQTTILRGGSASESVFADVAAGHRFLHVATHGFFAPETVQNAMTGSVPDDMMIAGETRSPKLTGQHPDLLSGLVFAGANQKPDSDTENDGILTAAEVQSLELRKVDLAVLSACETGLGRTAGGEGIIGLQRAFQLAGARTTITSLWKVDDAATQALMVEFYRNLFERKLSKLESLR